MKITKRQLRRIIREMHPRAEVDDRLFDYEEFVDAEGHVTPASSSVIASYAMTIPEGEERWRAVIDLTTQYDIDVDDVSREIMRMESEREAGGLSQEVEHLSGGRKSSWQAHKERHIGESKTKITKRQLRRIIREQLQIKEGTLYVSRSPYGVTVEDDNDEYVAMGHMVKTLLDAGDDDIFQAPQGVDPQSLDKMMAQHERGIQGGLENWDPDVFQDYYNVDLDRVVRLYARRMNLNVQEVNDDYDGIS